LLLATSPTTSPATWQLATRPASSTPALVLEPARVPLAPAPMSVVSDMPGKALTAGTTAAMVW
jgi:hypothetical protein